MFLHKVMGLVLRFIEVIRGDDGKAMKQSFRTRLSVHYVSFALFGKRVGEYKSLLFCAALLFLCVGFLFTNHNRRILLDPASIKADSGYAYATSVIIPWVYRFLTPSAKSDTNEVPAYSSMTLYEDGTRVGPPHQSHDTIRNIGGGRYSHWQNHVTFSASDNSDPRTNGREYAIAFPIPKRVWVAILGLWAFFIIMWLRIPVFRIANPVPYYRVTREIAHLIYQYRQLTWAMTRREITDRYAGQAMGVLWAIGHPLILLLVYAFFFVVVFKVRFERGYELPRDFVTYLLAGAIPWMAIQDSMSKGCTAITGQTNLVKQVVFPVEVLPVKGVIASLITQVISTALLFGYQLLRYGELPWTWAFWPVFIAVQSILMIGLSFLFSAIGVYFRDLKDFVQVFCTVGFYMMPIFYTLEQFPERYHWLLYINPFTYVIICSQDLCYYGRIEHPWAWGLFLVSSLVALGVGYRFFRRLKPFFGSAL